MAENIMRVNWSYTYDVHVQDGWRVLKFVSDLWNLLFLSNKSIVHFCEWAKWGGGSQN